jgi:DNA mismatch repair protein MutS
MDVTLSSPEIKNPALDTPMLHQYQSIKNHHQDAILFFRLGDFYEMFLEDAIIASKALDLTLTGRGKDENRVPMCGIPYHASESYIAKLVTQGFKVAICEQVEDASASKGLTKRDVVKIITPGTLLSPLVLDETENNFILAATHLGKTNEIGASLLDLSTGDFRLLTLTPAEFDSILAALPISEIITNVEAPIASLSIPEGLKSTHPLGHILQNSMSFLSPKSAETQLTQFFHRHASASFGWETDQNALPAAWALLEYVTHTQKTPLTQITKLTAWNRKRSMMMDRVTLKNLELTESREKHHKTGSLFWVLDYTKTPMGARQLKSMIKNPITDLSVLEKRLDAVESILGDLECREEIRLALSQIGDLERLIARLVSDHQNPRDCLALKAALEASLHMGSILEPLKSDIFEKMTAFFKKAAHPQSPTQKIATLIKSSIRDDAPVTTRDGNIIKLGYSEELDQLVASFSEIRAWIQNLEQVERDATGIKSLKVGFNKVFGYYLEVPKSQVQSVPETYIRKQTLANAERYITPDLKEKETILLHAEEKQLQLELTLFQEIITAIQQETETLQRWALNLARLDALQSLATAAQKHHYTRPKFAAPETQSLILKNSRHPILERNSDAPFISNSINMNQDTSFILLTGPNMAGKSTLMRQIALTIVMAQMGSFVPADEAILSVVDQLFTRIGALDNLYFGQSTFMVEMLETASILHNATENSLIILDEIGRGTATYDGMSIACAVSEHIHSTTQARTLFATHYHELTSLDTKLERLKNFKMDVIETETGIVFPHTCSAGPADKSYGIHVAKMAGLPENVIDRASEILNRIESQGNALKEAGMPIQLSLF